ncbi:MAG: transcription antitermination factor NusB [Armatimonadota bacterium]|nr:transcription antitermination factor NusB [Armatimonadota bacterium]
MKTRRRRARDTALQVLFQHDVGRLPIDEALAVARRDDASVDWDFVEVLCRGVAERQAELDDLILQHLAGWTLDRLASIDRVILRMALYELRHLPTPSAVVINEAVELAKRYGTDDSGRFVNGVLGAVHREGSHAGEPRPAPGS